MAEQSYKVPGLARGIQVLQLLEGRGPLSLDEITRATEFPKASVLRMLDTLAALELCIRDPLTRSYSAVARLVPISDGGAALDRQVAAALDLLATETGQTAEWYVPKQNGLILTQRRRPQAELHVRATIGFVRFWTSELDAVGCVGRAFSDRPIARGDKFWTYDDQGKRKRLTLAVVRRRLDVARREGSAIDEHYNSNGVRRIACPVLRDGSLTGVLALAFCFRPDVKARHEGWRQTLSQQSKQICK